MLFRSQKVTPISQPKTAPVVDLMQALQQSLKRTSGAHRTTAAKESQRKTARKGAAVA